MAMNPKKPIDILSPVDKDTEDIAKTLKSQIKEKKYSKPKQLELVSPTFQTLMKQQNEDTIKKILTGDITVTDKLKQPVTADSSAQPKPLTATLPQPEPEPVKCDTAENPPKHGKEDGPKPQTTELPDFKVDLNNIEIYEPRISSNELKKMLHKQIKHYYQNKKTYQVICFQSGYKAEMRGLQFKDIINLNNANVDKKSYLKRFYSIIHDHVVNTSIGDISFQTWLKITSVFDLNTLLYGIYCASYPQKNRYSLQCMKCKKQFEYEADNELLIAVQPDIEELMIKAEEIRNAQPDEIIQQSHMSHRKRVFLEDSKIIFELKVPSLYDIVDREPRIAKALKLKSDDDLLFLFLFIDRIYVPHIERSIEAGKPIYNPPVRDNYDILNEAIQSLSPADADELQTKVSEMLNKYHVGYSLKDAICPFCKTPQPDIPININNLLFFAMRGGRKVPINLSIIGTT